MTKTTRNFGVNSNCIIKRNGPGNSPVSLSRYLGLWFDVAGRAYFNDKAVGILKAVVVTVGLVVMLGFVQIEALIGFGAKIGQVVYDRVFTGRIFKSGQFNHSLRAVADFGCGVISFDLPANRFFVDERLVKFQWINMGNDFGDGVDLGLAGSGVEGESGPQPGAVAKVIAQVARNPEFDALQLGA